MEKSILQKALNYLRRIFKIHFTKILITFTLITYVFGMSGYLCFDNFKINWATAFFETSRHLFLSHSVGLGNENIAIIISQYAALVVFMMISGSIIIRIWRTILTNRAIGKFDKHIVIFGKNEICVEFIRKIRKREREKQVKPVQIVYIVKELLIGDVEKYQSDNLKIIEGNPLEANIDKNIFSTAKIENASRFFAVCEDDNNNVEIARNVWNYLKNHPKTRRKIEKKNANIKAGKKPDINELEEENRNALRCYALVRDNDLKNILEETPIFNYERKENEVFYFDGVVFNLNSVGVKYGINMEIENIIPNLNTAPRILIVGLNNASIAIMQNLAHIRTLNGDTLRFDIVENDEKAKIDFKTKYEYLYDFAKFDFHTNINDFEYENIDFASIFICNSNNNEAIKNAVTMRNKLQSNDIAIFLVTYNSDYIKQVFNPENTEKADKVLTFNEYNIRIFNRLEYFWDLIIEHRDQIEEFAKEIHSKYAESNFISQYDFLAETVKQSNRNAALDYYIKTYIAFGLSFDTFLRPQKRKENEPWKSLLPQIEKFSKEIKNIIKKKEEAKSTGETLPKIKKFEKGELKNLAIVEHRRWELDKFYEGWNYGQKRNNKYKIHSDLKDWDNLTDESKYKNIESLDLLIDILNKKIWL